MCVHVLVCGLCMCVCTCAYVLFACVYVCVFSSLGMLTSLWKWIQGWFREFWWDHCISGLSKSLPSAGKNAQKRTFVYNAPFLTNLFLILRDSLDCFLEAHILTLETWFTCMCSLCWWAVCFTNMLEGITLGLNSPQAFPHLPLDFSEKPEELHASCCLWHYDHESPHHRSSNVFILEVCRSAWIVINK